MHVTDLFAGTAVAFTSRFPGAFDQPGIGDKVLDCGEALDVVDLVEHDQGQNPTDAVHGTKPVKSIDIMDLGILGDVKLHLGEQLIVVIDEREVHLDETYARLNR